MTLCPACSEESARWLNYRPAPTLAIHHAGGDTLRSALSRRSLRAQDIYDTIRSQQALIRSICERLHTPTQEAP